MVCGSVKRLMELFRGLWFCEKANGAAICALQLKQSQDVKLRFDACDVVNHA